MPELRSREEPLAADNTPEPVVVRMPAVPVHSKPAREGLRNRQVQAEVHKPEAPQDNTAGFGSRTLGRFLLFKDLPEKSCPFNARRRNQENVTEQKGANDNGSLHT